MAEKFLPTPELAKSVDNAKLLEGPDVENRREDFKKRLSGLHKGEVQRLAINIVDITPYIEQIAHRISEEKVREYMNKKGLKRLIGGLMHLSEDGYRRAFYNEAMDSIISNRNLMASIEATVFGRSKQVSDSDGSSRTLEILDEVMRSMDEKLMDEEQHGDSFVSDDKLNGVVSDLFVAFATGKITNQPDFEARVETDVIPFLKGKQFAKDDAKNAASERSNVMHASNLFHWAESYKDQIEELIGKTTKEHGEKNEEAVRKYLKGVLHLDVQLAKQGRSVVNRAPDAKKGRMEKLVSMVQEGFGDHPVNRVIGWTVGNPVVQGIFGAIATRAGVRWGATGLAALGLGAVAGPAGIAVAGLVGGAATAGVFGRLRAQKELKQDRGMVARDTTLGQKPGGERAEKMKEHVHTMAPASELLKELRAANTEERDANTDHIIARVQAYLDIERENMIDMIRVDADESTKYNSKIFSLHEIQRELKRLQPYALKNPVIDELRKGYKSEALAEIRERDAAFDEYLKKESRNRALKGAAIGLVGGAIVAGAHHVFPAPGEFVSQQFEKVGSAAKRLWSYMWDGDKAPVSVVAPNGVAMPSTRLQEIPYKDGTVRLPADKVLVSGGDGKAYIAAKSGDILTDSFTISPEGVVTDPNFEEVLKDADFSVDKATEVISDVDYAEDSRVVEFATRQLREQFEMPKNVEFIQQPDGTISLRDSGTGKMLESGLKVGSNGLFDSTSVATLKEHGWDVAQSSRVVTEALDKNELNKYLQEHYGQSKIKRIDWHGNGTPMRKVGESWVVTAEGLDPVTTTVRPNVPTGDGWKVRHIAGRWIGADGKELMLRLNGTPDERVLSIKEMIATAVKGPHNPDGSFDNRYGNISDEVYKKDFARAASNFRLRVFVGDNYWKSGEAFDVPVGADGEIALKKTDELYGVLFDEKGNLKVTVEAVVHDPSRAGYHTLATAVRHGDGKGVVAHVESFVKINHADTAHSRDVYDVAEGNSWIPSIPTPFFARKPMEVPQQEEKKKSQEQPVTLPPRKTPGTELVRARETFLAKKPTRNKSVEPVKNKTPKDTGPVVDLVENENGEWVPAGSIEGGRSLEAQRVLTVEEPDLEEELFEDEISQYELAHGKQSEKQQKEFIEKMTVVETEEKKRPTQWDKPQVFAGRSHEFVDFVNDKELRMLAAKDRPDRIVFILPEEYFRTNKIPSEIADKFIAEHNNQVGILFSHYGIKAVVVGEKAAPLGEEQLPVLSPEIARIGFEQIDGPIDVSLEKTREKIFQRMYRSVAGAGSVKPLLWIIEPKVLKTMVGKGKYPKEENAISQLQVDIQAIADRVSEVTGTRVVVSVVKNATQVEMTRAQEALLKRARTAA